MRYDDLMELFKNRRSIRKFKADPTPDMMVLGYPDMIPKPKFLRDKEELVHFDYCGEKAFRTDEQVKDFIKRTRNWALAANPMRQSK